MTITDKTKDIVRGVGTDERPLTRVLWDRDSQGKIQAMEDEGNTLPQRRHVDFKRYYDPHYAELEIEKMWLKRWLCACREEDVPNVGDRVPFEVGRLSFLIVRTEQNQLKAFYNSCLHRGTKLCTQGETSDVIRCPYHAWEWKLDGSLSRIPSHWDFDSLNRGNASLREVKVDTWGGFIFINADEVAPPLFEALGPLPEHFADYDLEARYTAAHFRKLVPANWKLIQEAFMEAYHVIGIHPEAVPYNADSQAQYDIWSSDHGHVGRQVTPSAVPSIFAESDATPLAAAQIYMEIMKAWHYPEATPAALDDGKDLRAQVADWHRKVQDEVYGRSNEGVPDAVMIDSIQYYFFPHAAFWLSESLPFFFQFTPHETDPEKSYFEVRMLLPAPKDIPTPAPASRVDIDLDSSIAEQAPDFNFLAMIFDQDTANMPRVQAGVKAADPARHHSVLGTYQEMVIQHWNDVFDRLMAS